MAVGQTLLSARRGIRCPAATAGRVAGAGGRTWCPLAWNHGEFVKLLMLMGAVAAVTCAAGAADGDGWASYEVYQPSITRHDVLDARAHPHQYNHCATIAWFQDRWFCLWGSHTHPAEHAPGQRICFSTSRDGRAWTSLELLFSSASRCENPVRYPDGKGHQWQPNLAVVDGELRAVWNQGGIAPGRTFCDGASERHSCPLDSSAR